ncbi:hypothetical protein SYNTR_1842 [Candidatus Syntrophocurvum alkaliphilum]|uniref:FlgN protein n=1 Tax=Candidatus Syntrophocurvum alkaliphilum TaxID=2293317 RepID=A0A6I6DEB0_9FIRM|nr:flagellar protein FlgN [Candidatus Syntrophocurvum alkaliphilum]QGU00436.1 hypothetical protein SYNTR_1842 [Candidatus Syntrophocurvum alkaliphilum]
MHNLLKVFIDTINKQNKIFDQLVQLAEEKRESIILGKIQELDKLIQKEGIIVSNLEKTEGARFKLQEQIASKLKLKTEQMNAEFIITALQKNNHVLYIDLKEAIERLDYNLARLRALNEENNELINQSLDYIFSMQAAIEGDIAGTYSQKGTQSDETPSRPKKNIIDTKG